MFGHRTLATVRFLLTALIMGALSLVSMNVSAQEPDPPFPLHVGATGEALAEIPDDSLGAMAFNEDMTVDFGSCTIITSAIPGGCTIEVPVNTTVAVLLNEDQLPEGVAVAENPLYYTTGEEPGGIEGVTFELVYADGGEDPGLTYYLQLGLSGDPYGDIPDRSVSVSVRSEDGSVSYGSCEFDMVSKPDGCGLDVPAETTVVAEVDESTLPAGVVIIENPIAYTTPAEKTQIGDIVFELAYADTGEEPAPPEEPDVPVDPETPSDSDGVSELPNTGSGHLTSTSSDGHAGLIVVSSALALLSGAGAAVVRTSMHR